MSNNINSRRADEYDVSALFAKTKRKQSDGFEVLPTIYVAPVSDRANLEQVELLFNERFKSQKTTTSPKILSAIISYTGEVKLGFVAPAGDMPAVRQVVQNAIASSNQLQALIDGDLR
ncbi:hypothetical protein KBC75_03125 [Candidatus Shapirobacteria bacterium]|nr:hypothetical protein [Candidatus Shapirobacteria bacterium]